MNQAVTGFIGVYHGAGQATSNAVELVNNAIVSHVILASRAQITSRTAARYARCAIAHESIYIALRSDRGSIITSGQAVNSNRIVDRLTSGRIVLTKGQRIAIVGTCFNSNGARTDMNSVEVRYLLHYHLNGVIRRIYDCSEVLRRVRRCGGSQAIRCRVSADNLQRRA